MMRKKMMNRNTSSVFAILLICIVCTSNIARAEFSTLELVTNVTTNFIRVPMIGWEFKTNAAIQVTKLGFYDDGRDGLSSSHELGIFDTAGNSLLVATIGAGTVAPIEGPPVTLFPPQSQIILGAFRNVSVPPTVLAADHNYVIAATTAVSVDSVPVYDPTQNMLQTASEITLVQGRYISSGPMGFEYPYNLLPNEFVDFGQAFQFTVIPEPSTFALAAVGLAGLAAWGWRKRFGVDRC